MLFHSLKNSKSSSRAGFTLIEMLVVIAIIGLLSSAVLVGLNDARLRARDARRISDIRQIQNGLEGYYSGSISYPRNVYESVNGLPMDPLGGQYAYIRRSSQGYVLGACLERDRPANIQTFASNDQVGSINSPAIPPPRCDCSDANAYCVSIGVDD